MLKCPTCKKWLAYIKTTIDKPYKGNIVQVINIPARQCPCCGKIFIEDSAQNQITDFLSFRTHDKILDYELYEAIEILMISNVL